MTSAKNQVTSDTAQDTLARKSESANLISGGRLVAKALKAEGVDTIFTLCGGHIIDIYDGCIDEGIRIVDVRHEQDVALLPLSTNLVSERHSAAPFRR
jgi:acetolactate synthase-1/2/3 large subunit